MEGDECSQLTVWIYSTHMATSVEHLTRLKHGRPNISPIKAGKQSYFITVSTCWWFAASRRLQKFCSSSWYWMLIVTAEHWHFMWPLVNTVIVMHWNQLCWQLLKLSVARLPSLINTRYGVTMNFSGRYELLNCLLICSKSCTELPFIQLAATSCD